MLKNVLNNILSSPTLAQSVEDWVEGEGIYDDASGWRRDPDFASDELPTYLSEIAGIEAEEGGFELSEPLSEHARLLLAGCSVVLYHYTSSAQLADIARSGLVAGISDTNRNGEECQGVYLTTETVGPTVELYGRRAARVHGGEPVALAVAVPVDALGTWYREDPDDSDIASGSYQYVVPSVDAKHLVNLDELLAEFCPGSGRLRVEPESGLQR
ncbi:hypothetical protein [Ferrimonas marina]|uniref:Uncharacterized protein n=1 Tax=Ferrimonas marina TaxID=299255 RepID=A0A1M5UBV1_9GAMM|nr:hypothetical protein [Ferrimonas marina]SHH60484.1 hypothetical protein SAMN02745129_2494 [Ferrimonas marina]